jgi:hypothetical protein
MYNPSHARVKSNIGSMIDQGATEDEIETYIASEGVTSQDLQGTRATSPAPAPNRNSQLQTMFDDPNVPVETIEKFLTDGGDDISNDRAAIASYAKWRRSPEAKTYAGPQGTITLPKVNPAALQKPAEPIDPGHLDGLAGSFVEGIIPNLSLNATGVEYAGEELIDAVTDWRAPELGKAFTTGYEKQRAIRDGYEAHHPNLDTAGKTAGFIGSFALPVTKIGQAPKAAALLSEAGARKAALKYGVVNGAATGALYGGTTGLLNDSGEGRLTNAAFGAGAGATLGAAATPIIRGAATAAQWTRQLPGINGAVTTAQRGIDKLTGRTPDIPAPAREAQRRIASEMEAAPISTGMGTGNIPMTADNVASEIARRQDLGTPAVPADLSEPSRALFNRALSGRGPMASRARTQLEARQAAQGARIRQHVQSEMADALDPIQAIADIQKRATQEAAPNYRQAYAEGVVITPELQEFMDRPVFQSALRQAYQNIRNRGGNPQELGMYVDDAGSLTLGNAPSLEALDHVVRTIRQDVQRDAFGKPMLNSQTGAEQDAASGLDQLLRKQNPAYDTAKSTYADDMAVRDALERGQKVANWSGHEINQQARTMPIHANEAWMTGAATATSDKAVKAGQYPTVNVSRAIRKDLGLSAAGREASLGDAVKVEAIERISGKPGMMARLDDRLETEDQAYRTFDQAFGNSKAYQRQADSDSAAAGIGRAVRDLSFGSGAAALTGLLFQAVPQGAQRFRTEVQEYIADTLSKTDPQDIQQAFAAIEERAAKDNNFKAILNRAGIQLGRLSASTFGSADGDPYDPGM